MFLIVYSRKEIKNLLYFLRDCLWEVSCELVQNKSSFVSLRCRFGGDNKNITQKKGEKSIINS